MATTVTDQIRGITISESVKAPVRTVASSTITLAAEQTVNGVALVEGDRVLCIAQTSGIDNGIYNVSTGTWQRAPDFDGNDDVVQGTIVLVNNNGTTNSMFEVTAANPIVIGTTSITFIQANTSTVTYDRTAAEIVASVTPTNYYEIPGYIERYGGSQSASAATNTTALTNALATGHHVRLKERSGFYSFTGRVVAPANSWITLDGCELRWSATAATGTNFMGIATRPGIEVTGNNFQLDGYGLITGPSTASYVSNECGIYMTGTSTSARKSGCWISGIEFSKWGAYPILLQFVSRFEVKNCNIHDSGYIGVHLSSCDRGKVGKNEIYSITPGTGGEAHGISLSHDSTNYSADPNATTNGRLAVNPYCEGIDVDSNTVYDIPIWHGIDCHGAYEVSIRHNKVYNCYRGITCTTGSNSAAAYGGEGNSVCYNKVTPRKRDGSATTVSGSVIQGILVNGGTTLKHRGIRVIGNDIDGCGDSTSASASIMAQYVSGAVIQGNSIRNWAGPGIYITNGSGTMSGNKFGAVSSASSARCIWLDTGSLKWEVTGNGLELEGGTAPAEGLRITSTVTSRQIVEDNNFDAATTPYVNVEQALSGAGAIDIIHDLTQLTTTGANALTLADGVERQIKKIVMLVDGGDGTLTPTNLRQYTTITFNDVGDSVTLLFTSGKWQVMSSIGCALA